MREDGLEAMIGALEAQGFEVDLQDTGRIGCERFICRLSRGNFGAGFFAATELAAVRKAVEAVQVGRFSRG